MINQNVGLAAAAVLAVSLSFGCCCCTTTIVLLVAAIIGGYLYLFHGTEAQQQQGEQPKVVRKLKVEPTATTPQKQPQQKSKVQAAPESKQGPVRESKKTNLSRRGDAVTTEKALSTVPVIDTTPVGLPASVSPQEDTPTPTHNTPTSTTKNTTKPVDSPPTKTTKKTSPPTKAEPEPEPAKSDIPLTLDAIVAVAPPEETIDEKPLVAAPEDPAPISPPPSATTTSSTDVADTPAVAETPVTETLVAKTLVAETLVAETLVAETLVAETLVAETLVTEATATTTQAQDTTTVSTVGEDNMQSTEGNDGWLVVDSIDATSPVQEAHISTASSTDADTDSANATNTANANNGDNVATPTKAKNDQQQDDPATASTPATPVSESATTPGSSTPRRIARKQSIFEQILSPNK